MRKAKEHFEKKQAEVQFLQKKKEAELLQRKKEAELLQKKKEAEVLQKKKKEAELLQKKKEAEVLQVKNAALNQNKEDALAQRMKDDEGHQKQQETMKKKDAEMRKRQQKEATVTQRNHQQGKEVVLYNVFRDHTTPVAKATILSTDRKKMVGGRELGVECCEVVINYIIKRDALLPRPIGNVTIMGQAQGRSIAWLYKHMEEQNKSTDKPTLAPNVS